MVETGGHILTFDKPNLPAYVQAAFHRLPVRHYIPSPLRCFKCQKYGHTSTRCSNEQICACGKPLHCTLPCEESLRCVNCTGNHSSRSKNCPQYKIELAIQEIKVKEKLSYIDAKKRVAVRTPQEVLTYAKATANAPACDTNSLIKEIIPHLVQTLKEMFVCKDTNKPTMTSEDVSITVASSRQVVSAAETSDCDNRVHIPPVEMIDTSSFVRNLQEKRKRNEHQRRSENDSLESDESESGLSQSQGDFSDSNKTKVGGIHKGKRKNRGRGKRKKNIY